MLRRQMAVVLVALVPCVFSIIGAVANGIETACKSWTDEVDSTDELVALQTRVRESQTAEVGTTSLTTSTTSRSSTTTTTTMATTKTTDNATTSTTSTTSTTPLPNQNTKAAHLSVGDVGGELFKIVASTRRVAIDKADSVLAERLMSPGPRSCKTLCQAATPACCLVWMQGDAEVEGGLAETMDVSLLSLQARFQWQTALEADLVHYIATLRFLSFSQKVQFADNLRDKGKYRKSQLRPSDITDFFPSNASEVAKASAIADVEQAEAERRSSVGKTKSAMDKLADHLAKLMPNVDTTEADAYHDAAMKRMQEIRSLSSSSDLIDGQEYSVADLIAFHGIFRGSLIGGPSFYKPLDVAVQLDKAYDDAVLADLVALAPRESSTQVSFETDSYESQIATSDLISNYGFSAAQTSDSSVQGSLDVGGVVGDFGASLSGSIAKSVQKKAAQSSKASNSRQNSSLRSQHRYFSNQYYVEPRRILAIPKDLLAATPALLEAFKGLAIHPNQNDTTFSESVMKIDIQNAQRLLETFGSHICPRALLGAWWRQTATVTSLVEANSTGVQQLASRALQESRAESTRQEEKLKVAAFFLFSATKTTSSETALAFASGSSNTTGLTNAEKAANEDSTVDVSQEWFGGNSGMGPEGWRESLKADYNSNWRVIDRYLDDCIGVWSFIPPSESEIDNRTLSRGLCRFWATSVIAATPAQATMMCGYDDLGSASNQDALDQYVTIRSKQYGLCLSHNTYDNKVYTTPCAGVSRQGWYLQDGRIRSNVSDLCLELTGPASGTMAMKDCSLTEQNQVWAIDRRGNFRARFIPDLCVEASVYGTGKEVRAAPCHGRASQRWAGKEHPGDKEPLGNPLQVKMTNRSFVITLNLQNHAITMEKMSAGSVYYPNQLWFFDSGRLKAQGQPDLCMQIGGDMSVTAGDCSVIAKVELTEKGNLFFEKAAACLTWLPGKLGAGSLKGDTSCKNLPMQVVCFVGGCEGESPAVAPMFWSYTSDNTPSKPIKHEDAHLQLLPNWTEVVDGGAQYQQYLWYFVDGQIRSYDINGNWTCLVPKGPHLTLGTCTLEDASWWIDPIWGETYGSPEPYLVHSAKGFNVCVDKQDQLWTAMLEDPSFCAWMYICPSPNCSGATLASFAESPLHHVPTKHVTHRKHSRGSDAAAERQVDGVSAGNEADDDTSVLQIRSQDLEHVEGGRRRRRRTTDTKTTTLASIAAPTTTTAAPPIAAKVAVENLGGTLFHILANSRQAAEAQASQILSKTNASAGECLLCQESDADEPECCLKWMSGDAEVSESDVDSMPLQNLTLRARFAWEKNLDPDAVKYVSKLPMDVSEKDSFAEKLSSEGLYRKADLENSDISQYLPSTATAVAQAQAVADLDSSRIARTQIEEESQNALDKFGDMLATALPDPNVAGAEAFHQASMDRMQELASLSEATNLLDGTALTTEQLINYHGLLRGCLIGGSNPGKPLALAVQFKKFHDDSVLSSMVSLEPHQHTMDMTTETDSTANHQLQAAMIHDYGFSSAVSGASSDSASASLGITGEAWGGSIAGALAKAHKDSTSRSGEANSSNSSSSSKEEHRYYKSKYLVEPRKVISISRSLLKATSEMQNDFATLVVKPQASEGSRPEVSGDRTVAPDVQGALLFLRKYGSHVCPRALLGGWWKISSSVTSKTGISMTAKKQLATASIDQAIADSTSGEVKAQVSALIEAGALGASGSADIGKKFSNSSSSSGSIGLSESAQNASKSSVTQVTQEWYGGSSGLGPTGWRHSLKADHSSNWRLIDRYLDDCLGVWEFVEGGEGYKRGLCKFWVSTFLAASPDEAALICGFSTLGSQTDLLSNAKYSSFHSKQYGFCLSHNTFNNKLYTSECLDNASFQAWLIQDGRMRSNISDLCLTLLSNDTVGMESCKDFGIDQMWYLDRRGDLRSRLTNGCLEAPLYAPKDNEVFIRVCHGRATQRWMTDGKPGDEPLGCPMRFNQSDDSYRIDVSDKKLIYASSNGPVTKSQLWFFDSGRWKSKINHALCVTNGENGFHLDPCTSDSPHFEFDDQGSLCILHSDESQGLCVDSYTLGAGPDAYRKPHRVLHDHIVFVGDDRGKFPGLT